MARTGRPRKEINIDQFKYMCKIMCTEEEIAGFFDCSVDTIERWCKRTFKTTFAETYKTLSAEGKMSLRRLQFKLAEDSPAMAIFLGKNYLGQSDRIDQTVMEISADTRTGITDVINELRAERVVDTTAEESV